MKGLNKIHKTIIFSIVVVTLILTRGNTVEGMRNNEDDIIINVDKINVYRLEYSANIEIKFEDTTFYNEDIYLSYHIYDEYGDVIRYENERKLVNIDANGIAKIQLDVDLTTLPNEDRKKKLEVKYDLVDVKNSYWFSTNADVKFIVPYTYVENKPLLDMTHTLVNEIKQHVFVFIINISVVILSVIMVIRFRKDQLFE